MPDIEMRVTGELLVRCPGCGEPPKPERFAAAVGTVSLFRCDNCSRYNQISQWLQLVKLLA